MKNKLTYSTLLFFICITMLLGCSSQGEKPSTKVSTLPTQPIIYSTEEIGNTNEGRIEGIITSASDLNKPLTEVVVELEHHPFFEKITRQKYLQGQQLIRKGNFRLIMLNQAFTPCK